MNIGSHNDLHQLLGLTHKTLVSSTTSHCSSTTTLLSVAGRDVVVNHNTDNEVILVSGFLLRIFVCPGTGACPGTDDDDDDDACCCC